MKSLLDSCLGGQRRFPRFRGDELTRFRKFFQAVATAGAEASQSSEGPPPNSPPGAHPAKTDGAGEFPKAPPFVHTDASGDGGGCHLLSENRKEKVERGECI